jgi:oligopeptide transport system substrate-binding protein
VLYLAMLLAAAPAASVLAASAILHHGTAADPPSLDPNIGGGSLAGPIMSDLFVGLLARDAHSRPSPASAESWVISPDGRTYTFRMRPNLRWSDGRALTAEDFVYSYRRLMTPATGSQLAGVFFFVENARDVFLGKLPPEQLGITAPDAATVVFRLNHPVPYLLELIGNSQVVPVPRHVIEQHGREWTRPGRMVSNGAYMLAERVPQSFIRLVKNPHFFAAEEVRVDEIYWHPTQDLGTSLRRFRSGELDVVLNFPPDEIDWIRANLPEALHIVPALGTYFLTVNTRRKPFDDARVRKALSLAIDREAIIDRLLRTGVKPAWTFATPDFEGYGGITLPEQRQSVAQRQTHARGLLREAGFGPENPLTVPLIYDTQEENRKIMVSVAAMWQEIGVKTQLTNLEFGGLQGRVRAHNYDVARFSYFAPFDDAYAFLQLLASGNPGNWPGYANPDYDALLARYNQTPEPAKRAAILREAETVLMSEYPVIPIYYYVWRRLVSPRVGGWVDNPRGTPPTRFLWVKE